MYLLVQYILTISKDKSRLCTSLQLDQLSFELPLTSKEFCCIHRVPSQKNSKMAWFKGQFHALHITSA